MKSTALVATGHGRDCILIDLDERNYELALQRVGPVHPRACHVTHGTFNAYTNGRCRCDPCKQANADHQRMGRRWYNDLTREQRKVCQICHTPLNVHPIKSCWREA